MCAKLCLYSLFSAESAAIPSLTLEFAALCLRNARVLLPEVQPSLSDEMLAEMSENGRQVLCDSSSCYDFIFSLNISHFCTCNNYV